jgi:long-chain fatty acid transport protein
MLSRVRFALLSLLSAAGALAVAPAAWAGGFAVPDQTAQAMGLGGAFVARASGADSFQSNVAGLAFAERTGFVLGGGARLFRTDFTGDDPYPGALATETQRWAPPALPVFGYAQPLRERVVLGVGLSTPFDLRTSWDLPSSFSGRFIAQSASLRAYAVSPSLAIRLADRLAVGGSVDVYSTRFLLDRRLAAVNPFTQHRVDGASLHVASDTITALSFRAGLLARPTESFSFGLAYRHGVSFDLTGTGAVTRLSTGVVQLDNSLATVYPGSAVPFTEAVTLPWVGSAGVAYSGTDWTLAAQIDVENWGSFGSLAINFPDAPALTTVVARGFKSTYALRVGIERRLNRAWTLRGGYSYETTPVSANESLSPAFIDASRHGIAVGFTVRAGAWRIDAAPGLMLYGDRATLGGSPEGFNGTYKSQVPVFGLTVGHGF